MINASVVTNDYNLNKVAGVQGVSVLNVNDLANAVKTCGTARRAYAGKDIKRRQRADAGRGVFWRTAL